MLSQISTGSIARWDRGGGLPITGDNKDGIARGYSSGSVVNISG